MADAFDQARRQLDAGREAEDKPRPTSGELFVVDNSDDEWKVAQYLREWCEIARALDLATGYFDIAALLALDGQWQKLDQARILMGGQVSLRTKRTFEQAIGRIAQALDNSIEREKERNDFLQGVPAIVAALQEGRIACRVYRERNFHAKAYITHARARVMGATALVGSSNFTFAGLSDNVELNVRLRSEVETLQQWYEHYWNLAEDVTPQMLRVVQRHVHEYTLFVEGGCLIRPSSPGSSAHWSSNPPFPTGSRRPCPGSRWRRVQGAQGAGAREADPRQAQCAARPLQAHPRRHLRVVGEGHFRQRARPIVGRGAWWCM